MRRKWESGYPGGIMADECSIKFWLNMDLYNSILALAYRKRTSMSKVLRTLCKAVQDISRQYYLQLELDRLTNPPKVLTRAEMKQEIKEFRKSRPGLDDLYTQAKMNLKQELSQIKQEKKTMDSKKSVKFFISDSVFEFVRAYAYKHNKTMSGIFRDHAVSIAETLKQELKDGGAGVPAQVIQERVEAVNGVTPQ